MATKTSNSTGSTAATKPTAPKTPRARAATTKAGTARAAAKKLKSRAVVRDVEAGSSVDCAVCGERVKFQAKVRNKQVICNVYTGGKWNRVEHYHAECYEVAGQPFGEAEVGTDYRRAAANAAAADRAKQLAQTASESQSA